MALTKVIGAGVGSLTEDLALSDSDKIKLGAGSDLQLYHDGSHSYIDEVGTGSLYVRASIIRWTNADGSETLGGVDADGGWFLKANNSNALVIDTNGHVTKPLQSAFMAQPGSQIANIATGANEHLAFGTERFDQNSDYNTSTYQFTAPVTGKYMCNVNLYFVYLDSAVAYYELRIDTSNRDYYSIIDPDFGQDNTYFTLNFSQLVDMDANDTCDINFHQQGGTSQTDIQVASVWSMYLVC
jgi:hypothetical protein